MKKILLALCFVLISTTAFAEDRHFCNWSGTKGTNCLTMNKGYVMVDGFPRSTITILNSLGFYEVIVTQPTLLESQVKDGELWDKVGNNLTLTWEVRDKTTEEITQETAGSMSLEMYAVLKWFVSEGVVSPATAPAKIKQAYLARDAMQQ